MKYIIIIPIKSWTAKMGRKWVVALVALWKWNLICKEGRTHAIEIDQKWAIIEEKLRRWMTKQKVKMNKNLQQINKKYELLTIMLKGLE